MTLQAHSTAALRVDPAASGGMVYSAGRDESLLPTAGARAAGEIGE